MTPLNTDSENRRSPASQGDGGRQASEFLRWGLDLADTLGRDRPGLGAHQDRLGPTVGGHFSPVGEITKQASRAGARMTFSSPGGLEFSRGDPSDLPAALGSCCACRWLRTCRANRWLSQFFGERMFEQIEIFIGDRAGEILQAVLWLGESNATWFTIGTLSPLLLMGFGRMAQLLPGEDAWPLAWLRFVGRFIAKAAFYSLGVVAAYFFCAWMGGEWVWSAYDQAKFWQLVRENSGWGFYGLLAGTAAGVFLRFAIARWVEPSVAKWLHKVTKSTTNKTIDDEHLTDARFIVDQLPQQRGQVDHEACFAEAQRQDAVFLGCDAQNRQVFVPRQQWKKSHVQICGPTGTGKGIQASIALAQGVRYDDAIYAFDPKSDEFAPHVLADQCEKAEKPFRLLSLPSPVPQCNLIRGISQADLFELFVAGFGLADKGEASDFYRLDDRKAAYQLSFAIIDDPNISIPELFDREADYIDAGLMQSAKGFLAKLEELARIPAFQTREGLDLAAPLTEGGMIYIIGGMRGPEVPAQKMVALRVIQLVEKQENPTRHVSIFLDEIKFLLSDPTVKAFPTIRDKSCNLLLTHQSLQDFKDCAADLSPEAVDGAIRTNTQLKWIYRCAEPQTAEWAAKLTGKILVDTERRFVERNEGIAETMKGERMLDQVERYRIDENMLLHLPEGCALLIGAGPAQLAIAQFIPTQKRTLSVTPAPTVERTEPGQDLIDDDPEDPRSNNPGDDLL